MERKIKLGIVGFGRIVELVHLPLIKRLPEIEVSGVHDITEQRQALAAKRGFHTLDSLDELLASDADIILVSTPPNSHYAIANQALRSGKHVIIEKPVTVTHEEASSLLKTSEQVGRFVTVFQNRRFDPDFKLVKRVLDEGMIGDILFVERRHHMFGSGATFGVKSFHEGWRNTTEYGGGALFDWGVHLIDQLLQLKLGTVREISSFMHCYDWDQNQVDDYVRANMVLDNNIILNMEVNFGSLATAPMWVVGGDKGTVTVVSPSEAYVMEKGKQPEPLMLEPVSRESALPIYQSVCDHLLREGPLAITLSEAVETMRILEEISRNRQSHRS